MKNGERGWQLENTSLLKRETSKRNDIPTEMIVKSFEKCGISNALDISENGLEDGGEEKDEEHIVVTLENIENEDCIIELK